MKSNTIKRLTAVLLTVIMLLLSACSADTVAGEPHTGYEKETETFKIYSETTQNIKKSETVYANLTQNGQIKTITVSDWLHADKGEVFISDITTLKDFRATKGHASSVSEKGEVIWQADSSDVYYEGFSDKALPVDISIRYFLDEQEITPENLSGKSGKFRMEISLKNNTAATKVINGQQVTMYTPLVAVGGMMLPYDTFSDIEITNGMSVGGGTYEAVVLTGAPGLTESLNLNNLNIEGLEGFSFPNTFTVSATVTDFTLGDVYFALTPLSSLNMDIQLPNTLDDVKTILTKLQNVQAVIEQIDPNNVLANFMSNSESVNEMLDILNKGLTVYNENQKMLETMTSILTPENIETLTNFINSLDAEEMKSMMNLMSNLPAIATMIGSIKELSEGFEEVKPILDSFTAAMEDPEVAASLEKLPETLNTLSEVMTFLNENKELLEVMTKLMESDDINQLTELVGSIQNGSLNLGNTDLAELSNLSVDTQELIARMEVWLSFNYGIYTSAYDYMQTSCMFICKTDPIK